MDLQTSLPRFAGRIFKYPFWVGYIEHLWIRMYFKSHSERIVELFSISLGFFCGCEATPGNAKKIGRVMGRRRGAEYLADNFRLISGFQFEINRI